LTFARPAAPRGVKIGEIPDAGRWRGMSTAIGSTLLAVQGQASAGRYG